MPAIPERQPVGDLFRGAVLRADTVCLLARDVLPDTTTLASGELTIRYGVQVLGKPHLAIVPGLIALDYGDMLTGEDAWDFLLHHSNLHPRADVLGYRSDGTDDMIVVKLLDLAQPVQVFVYSDAAAVQPVARVDALIAANTTDLPARLLDYLPTYASLEAWQHRE